MENNESFIGEIQRRLPVLDHTAADQARRRWNSIAKPLFSLGLLEEAIIRIAALTGDPLYPIDKRAVLVLCADNGVVRQGVTQTGSDVTAILAKNLVDGKLCLCRMAALANADIIGVDMGLQTALAEPRLLSRRLGPGTNDISQGPAMTREQATQAIRHGIDLVDHCKQVGYRLLATGELGIGNTTTSSALASVFLGMEPEAVTGRGAGLPAATVKHKAAVISQAIAVNGIDPAKPFEVLAALGGFDIAGMVGIYIGCAIHRIPVLLDGFISSVAALTAERICPGASQTMLATHVSAEPAAGMVLSALGLYPFITANMCLGEGTGAVAAMPMLDMAHAVYNEMSTYQEMDIEPYVPYDQE